ncbi:hypothetical protein SIL81_19000 [Xanthomonas campestris pv. incanae]|uniref:hypothetical protein n=1 Tax=Xanthomonas campestris TaxID=339 RepID=UPI00226A3151|nr:hypothetical protein [Xanthomonas campestris]MDX6087699.1 hypothetical protein [Xanthomonas campestris pv. incanae]MDX6141234.1 hypothetical protein [Xanthomonas campestris pv. incanae]MEB1349852.1 hypothetical protein [Xanthomonas campestris pv. campestris]
MTPTVVDALQRLAAALADLFQNEHLRYAAPGERAVVAELYVRVRERFPEYQVNDEYDRRERFVKDLIYPDAAGIMDEADRPGRPLRLRRVRALGGQHSRRPRGP